MKKLMRRRVRLKTLVVCTVVLMLIMVVSTASILYALNGRYRAEYFNLYEKLFSEALNSVSQDIVAARTVLNSVAADTSLNQLLTNRHQSMGDVVLSMKNSVRPMLDAQQRGLSGCARLYVMHGIRHYPSMPGEFYYDERCSIDGARWLRDLPASGSSVVRRETDPQTGTLKLYRPVYSHLTLGIVGLACVEFDADSMFRDRLQFDFPVNVYAASGELLWTNGRSSDGRFQPVRSRVPGLGLTVEFLTPIDAVLGGNKMMVNHAALIVIALAAVLGVSILVYVSFIGQLRRLIADMQQIAGGDRKARVTVLGDNELTQVARTCNAILDESDRALEHVVQSGRMERKAVYLALSNQLRPHFLNNAIDSVRMHCISSGDSRTADSLTYIMRYLSYNLGRQDVAVTLTDELSCASNYVEMLHLANESDVRFEVVPMGGIYGRLNEYYLPKFTLQPIVENCTRHAFVAGSIPRRVMITLEHADGQIFISVEDNGVGMPPERLEALRESLEKREDRQRDSGMGISLNLVRRRLELFYECEIPFTVDSYEGTGTMITFAVPDRWDGGASN